MVQWRPLILVLIFKLLIPACTPGRNSEIASAPPVEFQTETMEIVPSVIPGLDVSNDPTIDPENPPPSCLVTRPPDPPFAPPQPYPASAPGNDHWYGTNSLWTAIPQYGVWNALPHNQEGYTQKVFWWREGYSSTAEPEPQLIVTGRRLDAPAPPLHVSNATNAYAADIGSAMLVGVDFLTLGCWEITGRYSGTELSFVVWVAH